MRNEKEYEPKKNCQLENNVFEMVKQQNDGNPVHVPAEYGTSFKCKHCLRSSYNKQTWYGRGIHCVSPNIQSPITPYHEQHFKTEKKRPCQYYQNFKMRCSRKYHETARFTTFKDVGISSSNLLAEDKESLNSIKSQKMESPTNQHINSSGFENENNFQNEIINSNSTTFRHNTCGTQINSHSHLNRSQTKENEDCKKNCQTEYFVKIECRRHGNMNCFKNNNINANSSNDVYSPHEELSSNELLEKHSIEGCQNLCQSNSKTSYVNTEKPCKKMPLAISVKSRTDLKNINVNIEVSLKRKKQKQKSKQKNNNKVKDNMKVQLCPAYTKQEKHQKCMWVRCEPMTIIDVQPQKKEKLSFFRFFKFGKKEKAKNSTVVVKTSIPAKETLALRVIEDTTRNQVQKDEKNKANNLIKKAKDQTQAELKMKAVEDHKPLIDQSNLPIESSIEQTAAAQKLLKLNNIQSENHKSLTSKNNQPKVSKTEKSIENKLDKLYKNQEYHWESFITHSDQHVVYGVPKPIDEKPVPINNTQNANHKISTSQENLNQESKKTTKNLKHVKKVAEHKKKKEQHTFSPGPNTEHIKPADSLTNNQEETNKASILQNDHSKNTNDKKPEELQKLQASTKQSNQLVLYITDKELVLNNIQEEDNKASTSEDDQPNTSNSRSYKAPNPAASSGQTDGPVKSILTPHKSAYKKFLIEYEQSKSMNHIKNDKVLTRRDKNPENSSKLRHVDSRLIYIQRGVPFKALAVDSSLDSSGFGSRAISLFILVLIFSINLNMYLQHKIKTNATHNC
ncbi:unnamed protein product [Diabrotica balteata]|uniref:Uncharacterized protein n=1 Tax=Diabrotica balteata TaxID=107213 RepID=A0A9N9SKA8_DIABA|nr:unnamed protein product [Diabrotica balteata]